MIALLKIAFHSAIFADNHQFRMFWIGRFADVPSYATVSTFGHLRITFDLSFAAFIAG